LIINFIGGRHVKTILLYRESSIQEKKIINEIFGLIHNYQPFIYVFYMILLKYYMWVLSGELIELLHTK